MTALLVLLVMPFLWSAFAHAVRALAVRRLAPAMLPEVAERALLALMLLPIVAGAGFLVIEPRIEVSALAPLMPLAEAPPPLEAIGADGPAQAPGSIDWTAAIWAIAVVYALGFAWHARRLLRGRARVRDAIARSAPDMSWGGDVAITEAQTPPFAAKGRIVLPRALLEKLSPEQVKLIVAHERRHLERRDDALFHSLACIDVALWFNPFVRRQTERLRIAAELACDAAVTAAEPHQRKAYAQTLVAALAHAAGDALPCVPAVSSTHRRKDHGMRIEVIMRGARGPRKRRALALFVAAAAVGAPLLFAQAALARRADGAVAAAAETPTPSAEPRFSVMPLDGRLSSAFGPRVVEGKPQTHSGIDIIAPMGAPILAPAAGRVVRVLRTNEPSDSVVLWGYGNVVEIDHGGGWQTRYAHLQGAAVATGDEVRAGAVIAYVGSSGRSNGPHLHLELRHNGELVDPATKITLPPA